MVMYQRGWMKTGTIEEKHEDQFGEKLRSTRTILHRMRGERLVTQKSTRYEGTSTNVSAWRLTQKGERSVRWLVNIAESIPERHNRNAPLAAPSDGLADPR